MIETTKVSDLAVRFEGDLIRPEENGYEDARKIWNGGIDKRPGLIARAETVQDAVSVVRFATDEDLELSVKGGGHAVSGHALTHGGVMLDLGRLNGVIVDPEAGTATAGGGALWGDLDAATQKYGLATTGGVVSHTGVGGLTLGGGIGHLMRKFGLTVDNLLGCQLVTADGSVLTVNDDTEPDLMWGLRGGGGNFGVVTEFTFKLHPVGPEILGGPVIWRIESADEVLRFYRDWIKTAPAEFGGAVNCRLAPPMPFIPEEVHGKPVMMMIAGWWGDINKGEEILRPLRTLANPVADLIMPKPYVAHQSMIDPAVPHGWHYYWKSAQLSGFTDGVIETILRFTEGITSPISQAPIFQKGGAVRDVSDNATAFGARQAELDINVVGSWLDGDMESDRHVQWARDYYKALESETTGTFYVNFISDEGERAIRAAYGEERLKRLTELKNRYDPQNLFHLNHNIPPAK